MKLLRRNFLHLAAGAAALPAVWRFGWAQAGLDMHQNDLNKLREPAIWFRRQWDGRPSMNKVGGRPTLPSGIEWPRQSQISTPLHFLAQIDLSTLLPTPLHDAPSAPILPRRGLLFFFADMVEEMLWDDNGGSFANTRVILANQAGPERTPPADTPEILHAFGKRAGGYNTGITEYPPMALEPHVIDTFGGCTRNSCSATRAPRTSGLTRLI